MKKSFNLYFENVQNKMLEKSHVHPHKQPLCIHGGECVCVFLTQIQSFSPKTVTKNSQMPWSSGQKSIHPTSSF